MKAYTYKDSGIEWLGEIPSHWDISKVKNEFSVRPSNVNKKSEEGEEEVKLCNYVDVYYNDFITNNIDFMTATAREHEINKFQLRIGDVLITKDSEDPFDIGVPACVKETQESLLCGYHLSLIRTINEKIAGEYLFWSLKDYSIASQLFREATGVTRWAIASRHIKNASIAFPPLSEQKAIVGFLNKATARIDSIISIKQQQLAKLEDSVNSKIKELVALGLRGEKTKQTDIDWFSEIPESWRVIRLKTVLSKIGSGLTPKGGAASYVDEGVPIIRSQNVKKYGLDLTDVVFIKEETHEKMQNSKVSNNDVLLNITGASLGRVCLAEGIDEANVNQHVCIIRPFQFITPKFLYYLLYSEIGQAQVFSGFKGSGREGLNLEAIKSFRLPLPPSKSEQNEITDALDILFKRATKLSENINSQIKTLQNYRKSLIHECVTGKKQVTDRLE